MEREFVKRGKAVPTLELPGVAAVKLPPNRRGEEDINRLGKRAEIAPGSPLATAQPLFEQDGWVFLASDDLTEVLAAGSLPDGVIAVEHVYVEESGNVVLAGDRLDVRFQPDLAKPQIDDLPTASSDAVQQFGFAENLFHVQIRPGVDLEQVRRALTDHPEAVLYAEPVYTQIMPGRAADQDPDFTSQWHLHTIAADAAWEISRGEGVKIAIIDHGCKIDHHDLADAIDRNLSAVFIDPPPAAFRQDVTMIPADGHGTACASMAAARAFNASGGRGIAYEAEIMVVAVTEEVTMTQESLARAIAYAARPNSEIAQVLGAGLDTIPGADVISCSLGVNSMSLVLQDAIDFAVSYGRDGRGTPIFWAVADDKDANVSDDKVCAYPHVIAVGSSCQDDTAAPCASGPELAFLAPGDDVTLATANGPSDAQSGTSFATPAAAAVAALILAKAGSLTWQEVRDVMQESCDPVGGDCYPNGRNDRYGHGRINAARALAKALSLVH
ncbi:MAG: S8 family serine peptidase [Thermomicrobiales bacterium]